MSVEEVVIAQTDVMRITGTYYTISQLSQFRLDEEKHYA